MNLVIDCGNTEIKYAWFNDHDLISKNTLPLKHYKKHLNKIDFGNYEHIIFSSVSISSSDFFKELHIEKPILEMGANVKLPFQINYEKTSVPGNDRLASCAYVSIFHPKQNALIIDFGTCLTVSFLSSNQIFEGGSISPGLNMRLNALNHYTQRLPLVKIPDLPYSKLPITGKSTEGSILSGVINGITLETNGIINNYREQYSDSIVVFLTGGQASLFENSIKKANFVLPNMVLSGLNEILLHNL